MRVASLGIIKLTVIATFLIGCGQGENGNGAVIKPGLETDVTPLPEYNFEPFAGSLWKTKVRTALAAFTAYTGEHLVVLIPPDFFDRSHPNYTTPPSMEKVIVELPIGTRLRIERLMKDNGTAGLRVTISLEDERPLSDGRQTVLFLNRTMLVRNQFQFPGSTKLKEWAGNPDLLEKVDEKK